MKSFLREYWFYMVAPVALLLVLWAAAMLWFSGEDPMQVQVYNL